MGNPYFKLLLSKKMHESINTIRRLDENGQLYYMDYEGNYYGAIGEIIKAAGMVKKGGCSAFMTRTPEGDYLTCRNYDMPHLDEEKKTFGVNMVLHTKPKGKYESLAGVDTVWLKAIGIKVRPGCFDDGKTNLSPSIFLPYLCMDGINEKGLAVSVLMLDIKEGEVAVNQNVAGKKKIIITMLMRYILDQCSNLEQAVALAKSYNLVNTFGADYHLFVSDANGKSAVFEWRYNTFQVIRTDACTNCYVNEDDAEDCYYKDGLKEKWVAPEFATERKYHFGYGHGYERLKTIIKTLNTRINHMSDKYETKMTRDEAVDLLKSVVQDYDGSLTSFTQYSVIYNHQTLEACYYLQQDYSKEYKFAIKK